MCPNNVHFNAFERFTKMKKKKINTCTRVTHLHLYCIIFFIAFFFFLSYRHIWIDRALSRVKKKKKMLYTRAGTDILIRPKLNNTLWYLHLPSSKIIYNIIRIFVYRGFFHDPIIKRTSWPGGNDRWIVMHYCPAVSLLKTEKKNKI